MVVSLIGQALIFNAGAIQWVAIVVVVAGVHYRWRHPLDPEHTPPASWRPWSRPSDWR
jgi:hypothetical protein